MHKNGYAHLWFTQLARQPTPNSQEDDDVDPGSAHNINLS